MGGPRRVIAHLDCDAFYATVELLRRPELKGKPVIVAGSGPRAVVTTASLRGAQVRRRLGDARLARAPAVPATRSSSRPTSRPTARRRSAVWELVGERLDRVQPMGLDEAYADLTGVEKPLRVLRELVDEVQEQTGIEISVGVGPVAAGRQVLQRPRQARRASWRWAARRRACASRPRRRSRVPGIGPKTAERLAELGLRTIGQLQQADEAQLAARFGDAHGARS